MRIGMRIALSLSLFTAVAGVVLGTTTYHPHEWRGTVMLLVLAVSFLYVGLVLRGAVRRASVPVTEETMAAEELPVESEHIGPTIWPFVFSIAAVLLVVGLLAFHWVLIPSGIVFVGASVGWFRDIKRQWHPGGLAVAHDQAQSGSVSALEGEDQPDDQDHRHQD